MNKDAEIFRKAQTGDIVVPLKDACKHNGQYSESYPIGFPIFEKAMKVNEEDHGGVRAGDLVVVTGISGHGKTTYVQHIALNFAKIFIASIFFSYEVLIDNLYAKFKLMGINEDDNIFLTSPKEMITGNLKWVKEKIQEAKKEYFVKVVFIDHIDYLTPADSRTDEQMRHKLRNICQELKTIAIQEEVIIFLIAHTKKVEGREIEMQDIAESSGIYQLADFVFSVARGFDKIEEGDKIIKIATDEGIIKLLKNRLTGEMPYIKFTLENNKIKEIYE